MAMVVRKVKVEEAPEASVPQRGSVGSPLIYRQGSYLWALSGTDLD